MVVKPPAGWFQMALASTVTVVGGVAAGAALGGWYQTDPTKQAAAKSAGGSLGGLVTALAALGLAEKEPAWKDFGIAVAGLGVGLYVAGAAALATAPGGPLSRAASLTGGGGTPSSFVATLTNNGQTANLHVGDTVYAQLPVTGGSSWTWASSNPPVVSALAQTSALVGPAVENDGFTAVAKGSTTLTATQKDTSGNTLQTFTLNVVVS
jgi:uncharacterized protein YjdB